MIHQILQIIQQYMKRTCQRINFTGKSWKEMVLTLGALKPKLYHLIVKWDLPKEGSIKCNTDGACRGNPGIGTYGFCLRNKLGDLVYAESGNIEFTINVKAKMRAILKAIRYCVAKEIRRIIIESDSLLMVNIINKIWKVP